MLEVRELTVKFGGLTAVNRVNFEVQRGSSAPTPTLKAKLTRAQNFESLIETLSSCSTPAENRRISPLSSTSASILVIPRG